MQFLLIVVKIFHIFESILIMKYDKNLLIDPVYRISPPNF